jgi:hypothetical protein
MKKKRLIVAIIVIVISTFGVIISLKHLMPKGGGECTTEILKEDSILGKKGDELTACPSEVIGLTGLVFVMILDIKDEN